MDLYRIDGQKLIPHDRDAFKLERDVQRLLEANLETAFGVRFLATEFSTGEKQSGRIDSLGLDENGSPVIVEYKLSSSEHVINQALYYMDWLVDHRGDFELLVQKRLGDTVEVDWTSPRVLCVAESFSRYDSYAVQQMSRSVQLVQYRLFEGPFLLLDIVAGAQPSSAKPTKPAVGAVYNVEQHIAKAASELREVAEELRQYILELGEDVTEAPVKFYVAYRVARNFCCLEVHRKHVFLYLRLDPSVGAGCSICRDVREIGHFGTGDLEVRVTSADDVEVAKNLISLAYTAVASTVATTD